MKHLIESYSDWLDLIPKLKKKDTVVIQDLGELVVERTFFDFMKELDKQIIEKGIEVEGVEDTWLSAEVCSGFAEVVARAKSIRIKQSLENTKNKGGRPSNKAMIEKAIKMKVSGQYTLEQIEQATGITRSTIYRNMKRQGMI